MRDPFIRLPGNEARCQPTQFKSHLCPKCARYLAELPPTGATLADFSTSGDWGTDSCVYWLNAHDYHMRNKNGIKR